MVDAIPSTATAAHSALPRAQTTHSAWSTFLSELNPLQYLPVVGTIYRAVTGDTIPDTARMAGSLVVSGLTGGPVGVAVGIGTAIVERAAGIDTERLGRRLLARLGIGHGQPAAPVAEAAAPATPRALVKSATTAFSGGWSAAQLAAYGVQRSADGGLKQGSTVGADVLNGLELRRLLVQLV
jgi:hypothetical protein